MARDNRALEAANGELRQRVEAVREENLQVRRGESRTKMRVALASRCPAFSAPQRFIHLLDFACSRIAALDLWPCCHQVSEKILALDEDTRAARLAAAEADARVEALWREKGALQDVVAALCAEVADKMALLDEFEAKFARQYRRVQ